MERSKPSLTVLIVDDREENLELLQTVLARPGVEILLAESGPAALELLLRHDVALALLDVQMPGMDGFALAEVMRTTERTRSIPIIFVTAGRHDHARILRAYQLGAVDFLIKPVEPIVLRQKVGAVLELAGQRAKLHDALRLSETFVAVLAHDLRTPLTAISVVLDTLRSSQDLQSAAIADRLRGTVTRMGGLIDQLFDLSRVRLGRGFELALADLDLSAIIQRCVAELELSAGKRFSVHLPPRASLHGDEIRLAQVVSNILGNAVKHGDPASPIEVQVAAGEATVLTEVRNGGVIPPRIRGELFMPFKSSTARGGKRDGLGLGLYIADQIVRAHGGSIDVVCDDLSTTVRTHLPVRRESSRAP